MHAAAQNEGCGLGAIQVPCRNVTTLQGAVDAERSQRALNATKGERGIGRVPCTLYAPEHVVAAANARDMRPGARRESQTCGYSPPPSCGRLLHMHNELMSSGPFLKEDDP